MIRAEGATENKEKVWIGGSEMVPRKCPWKGATFAFLVRGVQWPGGAEARPLLVQKRVGREIKKTGCEIHVRKFLLKKSTGQLCHHLGNKRRT